MRGTDVLRFIMGISVVLALVGSKRGVGVWSDYAVAGTFAGWLCGAGGGSTNRAVRLVAAGLSNISYTLYVVHFPLMFFLCAVVLKGRQFSTGAEGLLWFGTGAVVASASAVLFWWLFERNTDAVRRWVGAKLAGWRVGVV